MAVKLRLTRMGKKKYPYYRIVAADEQRARDGRFIEILGIYHPISKDGTPQIKVEEEKVMKWLLTGAIPSDTVRSIFRKVGIMKKWHEEKLRLKKEAQKKKEAESGK